MIDFHHRWLQEKVKSTIALKANIYIEAVPRSIPCLAIKANINIYVLMNEFAVGAKHFICIVMI